MSAIAGPASSSTPAPGFGRVLAIVAGSLLALLAAALTVGGIALAIAHLTLRDDDGFYTSPTERLETAGHALTGERLDLGDVRGPGMEIDDLGADVRIQARLADDGPVFVGIAPAAAVDRWLAGVAHAEVTDFDDDGPQLRAAPGTRAPERPADAGIWAASSTGAGERTVQWEPEGGRWSAVVLRADGRAGVAADVSVGARVPWLVWLGLGLLAAGLVLGAGAAATLTAALHTPAGPGGPAAGAAAAPPAAGDPAAAGSGAAAATTATAAAVPAAAHPVDLRAELDEPLSRWLWIVKPILVIPHAIVLAFLWIGFVVLTLVALPAILATGRYPRAMFDFNVGVLRWTWRVGFYSFAALGTDRYPPFTLGPADYPADIDVPYPEHLSRPLALLKPWLLVLPHALVLTAFHGWWQAQGWAPPGLATVLALVAGAVLLVRGRYPRDVFDLLVGIARWTLRVAAYAALMRDEYPPFRLGR
ncbi:MAG TPA: DUF4389 domain-containing protein [Baekduia sp.]|nr:DUF4389 domain-containing protein [Baekduia sp.]